MKKLISIILVFIITSCSFCSCTEKNKGSQINVKLYFSNSAKDSLVTEDASVDAFLRKDTVGFVRKIMKLLLAGPKTEGYKSVIPEGVRLKGVSLEKEEDGTVNIDLSKEYISSRKKDSPKSEELLARYSIICTLSQFEEIKKVKIYIDGKDMLALSGDNEILSALGSNNIMIDSPSSVDTKTEKFVTLYFTDKNGVNLYPETHKATMADNSLEKTVVNELIRGPVSSSYVRTLPDGVQLISAETTGGICFVNFSAEFMPKEDDDGPSQRTIVYSVVNSLTRLPDIEKVQILIDGKKPEKDEYQLFSIPLERDESMIVNKK
ncbi:MAG: GerMN domain-containing protein [Clostridia bacterium]|nr:GerMN domain-containing protein [Clostridia bacterium]